MLRAAVLGSLELRIDAAAAAARDRLLLATGPDRPGGEDYQAREAAFKRDPGAYLPGAMPSIRRLIARAFWRISLDGRLVPCCSVSRAHLVGDLNDMVVLLDEEPYHTQGVVIGAPETADAIAAMLPANIRLVGIDLAAGGGA